MNDLLIRSFEKVVSAKDVCQLRIHTNKGDIIIDRKNLQYLVEWLGIESKSLVIPTEIG
jgi:hypothetical protein